MKILHASAALPRRGEARYFTGGVWVDAIAGTGIGDARVVRVTFEPGARTAWHSHPRGQLLHILSGAGRVQRAGDRISDVLPGDTIWFEAGERHWHGAAPDRPLVHLAVQLVDESGREVNWLEQVTDAEYHGRAGPPQVAPGEKRPSSAPTAAAAPEPEGPPVLTDEERVAGYEIREVDHFPDLPEWERTVRFEWPRFSGPAPADAYRVSVLKVLNDSDAVFRVRQAGRRAYAHLRWGHGSAWSYATFYGTPAWHPVNDPIDSARAAAMASVTDENPGLTILPQKFPWRPWTGA